jgi:hypothetical protein
LDSHVAPKIKEKNHQWGLCWFSFFAPKFSSC